MPKARREIGFLQRRHDNKEPDIPAPTVGLSSIPRNLTGTPLRLLRVGMLPVNPLPFHGQDDNQCGYSRGAEA